MKQKGRFLGRIIVCLSILVMLMWTCSDSYAITTQCPSSTDGQHQFIVTIEKFATATEDGVRKYTCDLCGQSYTETIPATGHSYEKKIIQPTCTSAGKTIYTCTKCGSSYEEDFGSPLGHQYEVTGDTAPTETEAGIKTYTCARCGDTYTENYGEPTGVATPEDTSKRSPEKKQAGPAGAAETVPFQAADAAIIGANGISLVFFALLLIPYFKVILWIRRKKKEAEEGKDDN